MWHKAIWKGHPMRLELTRVGLQVKLANHYTTRGAFTNAVIWMVSVLPLISNSTSSLRRLWGSFQAYQLQLVSLLWETKESGLLCHVVWGTLPCHESFFGHLTRWTEESSPLTNRSWEELTCWFVPQRWALGVFLLYIPDLRRVSGFHLFYSMDFSVCCLNISDFCMALGGGNWVLYSYRVQLNVLYQLTYSLSYQIFYVRLLSLG